MKPAVEFELQMRSACGFALFPMLVPIKELPFHGTRHWRFDFAWPEVHLAVEIDGGIAAGLPSHASLSGQERDREKDAEATILGWTVIHASTGQVRKGKARDWALRILKQRSIGMSQLEIIKRRLKELEEMPVATHGVVWNIERNKLNTLIQQAQKEGKE